MSTSGKWVTQNKKRPGTYVRTKVLPNITGYTSGSGAVAIGLVMSWGVEGSLIECDSVSYFNNDYYAELGVSVNDTVKALPYTLTLTDCNKAYFYRLDRGGEQASAILGEDDEEIEIKAKYNGEFGNKIQVVITKDKPSAGKYYVEIVVDGLRNESFIISTLPDLQTINSKWVTFDTKTATTMPETAGITLENGTNGTFSSASTETLNSFFDALKYKRITTVAINDDTTAVQQLLANYVMNVRDNNGKGIQAVCVGQLVNHEGVISIPTGHGFVADGNEIKNSLFTVAIAGWRAGCNYNESLTSRTLSNATNILSPIPDENVEQYTEQGYFILTYDIDGTICIEQDINTLVTYTEQKPEVYKKNQVVSVIDFISYEQVYIFNKQYCGKFTNTEVNRQSYKSQLLIAVFDYLVSLGAIEPYDSEKDVVIYKGEQPEGAVCDCWVQVNGTWEKLYVTNNLKF